MTIWAMKGTAADGTQLTLPDFDDGGDIDALYAHQIDISPNYSSTSAVPQTPVTSPDARVQE